MVTSGNTPDDLLALPELARYLRVAPRTAYLWAQQGKLPGFKLGSAWRFRLSEIEQWLEEQRTGPSISPASSLTDTVSQLPSKHKERMGEHEALKAMLEDCKQDILRKLEDDSRDVWTVEDIEDFYGSDISSRAINALRKGKQIDVGDEKGLQGRKVLVIRRRG